MTNNPTIDGVSCKTIERAIDAIEQVGYQDKFIDYTFVFGVKQELRDLLDAPVVERQPVCATCNGTRVVDDGELTYSSGGIPYEMGSIKCVKDCPDCQGSPEVAALQSDNEKLRERISQRLVDLTNMRHERDTAQSTIAQLQAENERLLSGFFQQVGDEDLKKISDFVGAGDLPERSFFCRPDAANLANMTMHMVREVQSLRNRIAELEIGRGEADAWALVNGGGLIRDLTDRWDVAKHWDGDVRSLYTAPPAPVAVVLPSPQEMHILISKSARQADLTAGANYFTAAEFAAIALLDKVKELNQ